MSDLYEVEQLIDKIALDAIQESAGDWKLSDERDSLIYRLAFNDAIIDFADRLKNWFRNNTQSQEGGKQ